MRDIGVATGASKTGCTGCGTSPLAKTLCQVKKGHGPQNLAAFRNAVISLLRLTGCKEIAPTLRGFCYCPPQTPPIPRYYEKAIGPDYMAHPVPFASPSCYKCGFPHFEKIRRENYENHKYPHLVHCSNCR